MSTDSRLTGNLKAQSMITRPVVLVAEDDPVFRRIIQFSIEAAGFDCEVAANGADALGIVDSKPIDFLVTDYQMPVCSGLQLIEQLRVRSSLEELPIVLCTAKGYELNATELIEQFSLVAVIRKPFSPKQLTTLITQAFVNRANAEPMSVSTNC